MSDTTTTDEPVGDEAAGEETPALEAPKPTKPPFWDRPYVERFLTPLVLPLVAVVGLVVYILNVSRLFLAAHGHAQVVIGTIVTVLILGGATLLANAAHTMRRGTIILVTCVFILLIWSGGWLTLGTSESDEAAGSTTLPPTLKTDQKFDIAAGVGGALKFTPNEQNAKTGLATFEVEAGSAPHTFKIEDAETLFAELDPLEVGVKIPGVAFFPAPGDYAYQCTISGHAAGGMTGVIHVTGDPMTLEEAEKAAGNDPGAAAAEGGEGGE